MAAKASGIIKAEAVEDGFNAISCNAVRTVDVVGFLDCYRCLTKYHGSYRTEQ